MFNPTVARQVVLLCLAVLFLLAASACEPVDKHSASAKARPPGAWTPPAATQIRGEEVAQLTPPPQVPPPIDRDYPTKLVVKLEVQEKVMRMADGVDYTFWT